MTQGTCMLKHGQGCDWSVIGAEKFWHSKVCDLGFVSSHDQEHIVTREVTMYDVICKSA